MSRRLVVDAAALVELLLATRLAPRVAAEVAVAGAELHVPALCDVEVAAALRRALARGRLDDERALLALQDLADLPLVRHGHQSLLGRVLALRHNLSAYDATYAALAERLDATLVTADGGLANAARDHLRLHVAAIV
ncbi:MAG TPA: type II toxin-antitoxin system VapC family toxin [Thermoanaerobaculia bacterium]|nr:type II toxin-antitoxin system VapC family toxin [Thermoanaerobaculia bacterium]